MLRVIQNRKLVNIVCRYGDNEANASLNPFARWFVEILHAPHRAAALAVARRAMAKAQEMEVGHAR